MRTALTLLFVVAFIPGYIACGESGENDTNDASGWVTPDTTSTEPDTAPPPDDADTITDPDAEPVPGDVSDVQEAETSDLSSAH